MHEAYLTLNGVRTSVVTHGKWVEESLTDSKDIVIILTGNPGVTGFYNTFAKTVHEQLGYPVWCVGHAGHNIPNEKISPFPELKSNPELYNLKGQLEHKVKYFCLVIYLSGSFPYNLKLGCISKHTNKICFCYE